MGQGSYLGEREERVVGSLPEEEWVRATSCEELVDILSPAEPVGEEVNALNPSFETNTTIRLTLKVCSLTLWCDDLSD